MGSKIKARTIIEILGAPKDHVEKTMQMVIDKLKTSETVKLLRENIYGAEKIKDQPFWSTFSEVEVETKDIEDLIGFCFDFMPSSIEILEPSSFAFQSSNINNVINDLLARLHQYDMVLKNVHAQNIILKKEIEKTKKENN